MYKIAVASGKGGTGKTLVSVNLSMFLASQTKTTYLDADVEGPNGYIFLKPLVINEIDGVSIVPSMKTDKCSGCSKCQEFCQFNAVIALADKVMVFNELCSSCEGCIHVCPENVLEAKKRKIGNIREGNTSLENLKFIDGKLNIGEARSTPLIGQLREITAEYDSDYLIIDSPPGTSCPVVETIKNTDFVVLVTEPTPFGLHDLKLVLGVCAKLKIKAGIVINRWGIGDGKEILDLADKTQTPILGKLKFSKKYAELYASGKNLIEEMPEMKQFFKEISNGILVGLHKNCKKSM